jgi:GMP synthase (glutamine-hydrolysing)
MPVNLPHIKTLLLQIRHEKQVKVEEHQSFLRYTKLHKKQMDVLNVYENPGFKFNIVDGYDAVFVGGTSNADVLQPDKYPFVPKCQDLMKYCLDRDMPVFASCFGFQLAIKALGGEILHKEIDFEMGVLSIRLSKNAITDPLFRDTANNFNAISVHRQYALKEPDGCTLLAYTNECCHSFKVKDKPFWAFQFHPEADKKVLIERLTLYRNKYTKDDSHLLNILKNAQETPESNKLLKKFVDRIILKKL